MEIFKNLVHCCGLKIRGSSKMHSNSLLRLCSISSCALEKQNNKHNAAILNTFFHLSCFMG